MEIFDYPARNEKILPKFDSFLPNFYFGPPWGNFVCSVAIPDFLGREVPRREDYTALTLTSEKHLVAYEP